MPISEYIMETPRLLLREMQISDAHDMFLLNSDPEVIRYTGDAAFECVAAAKEFLSNYSPYIKYGVGRWIVVRKSDLKILGWCGLKFHPDEGVYDVGYRFFREHWNQGYATESALACLDFGWKKPEIERIIGHAMIENKASIRVFENLGMQYHSNIDMDGFPAVLYEIFQPIQPNYPDPDSDIE
jgi:ribosomal-protein-alanine N-acetyltransferase